MSIGRVHNQFPYRREIIRDISRQLFQNVFEDLYRLTVDICRAANRGYLVDITFCTQMSLLIHQFPIKRVRK